MLEPIIELFNGMGQTFLSFFNKVLVLLYWLAIFNCIRQLWYFIRAWVTSATEQPIPYILSPTQLFLLGISLSYIMTGIIEGIKI